MAKIFQTTNTCEILVIINPLQDYCKCGNIRGTLISADFAGFSASGEFKNPQIIFAIFCMHILDT